jgi:predicted transcriptional regulator
MNRLVRKHTVSKSTENINSVEEVRISVTQEHIDKGSRGSFKSCPVALAIREVVKDQYEISVGVTYFKICMPPDYYFHHEINTPYGVGRWIRSFDTSSIVEEERAAKPLPFSFSVPIPKHFLRAK